MLFTRLAAGGGCARSRARVRRLLRVHARAQSRGLPPAAALHCVQRAALADGVGASPSAATAAAYPNGGRPRGRAALCAVRLLAAATMRAAGQPPQPPQPPCCFLAPRSSRRSLLRPAGAVASSLKTKQVNNDVTLSAAHNLSSNALKTGITYNTTVRSRRRRRCADPGGWWQWRWCRGNQVGGSPATRCAASLPQHELAP